MENFVDIRRTTYTAAISQNCGQQAGRPIETRRKNPEIVMSTGRAIPSCANENVWIAMTQSALTAGHTHVARQCGLQMPAVDHKVMPFWLTGNRLVDSRIKEFVALGRTQGFA